MKSAQAAKQQQPVAPADRLEAMCLRCTGRQNHPRSTFAERAKLFLTVIWAAEFENGLRSQRQIEANQIRRQKGLPTNNHAGYGRKIVNGRFVPDPVEQARIDEVYELYKRGWSVASIHRDVSCR